MIIFGIIGLLIFSYAIWVRGEFKKDELLIVGGICLLIYSISINNVLFIILQSVYLLSVLARLMKIRK